MYNKVYSKHYARVGVIIYGQPANSVQPFHGPYYGSCHANPRAEPLAQPQHGSGEPCRKGLFSMASPQTKQPTGTTICRKLCKNVQWLDLNLAKDSLIMHEFHNNHTEIS
jgi:hypothetical protein